MAKQKQQCNDMIASLKEQYDRDIKNLQQQNEAAINKLQAAHKDALDNLAREHDGAAKVLKDELRDKESSLSKLTDKGKISREPSIKEVLY